MDNQLPPSQEPAARSGLGQRVFRFKSVLALSLGSLILGGIGGAALGVVSADSNSEPGGQPGRPGQQGQLGQPGQPDGQGPPGQPTDGTGVVPDPTN